MKVGSPEEKQHRSMQRRGTAIECGFYGLCATVAVSLIGGVYGACSWDAARGRHLKEAVTNDLSAEGFVVKDVVSIRFISPPVNPEAVVRVGTCLETIGVERHEGHWRIGVFDLNLASSGPDVPQHTPVLPDVVGRAFPECFQKPQ